MATTAKTTPRIRHAAATPISSRPAPAAARARKVVAAGLVAGAGIGAMGADGGGSTRSAPPGSPYGASAWATLAAVGNRSSGFFARALATTSPSPAAKVLPARAR